MTEPDSWEDEVDAPPLTRQQQHQSGNPAGFNRLNANAPTFAFNPSANNFSPNYGPPPGQQGGNYAPPGHYAQEGYGGHAGYGNPGTGYGNSAASFGGYSQTGYAQPVQGYGQPGPNQGYNYNYNYNAPPAHRPTSNHSQSPQQFASARPVPAARPNPSPTTRAVPEPSSAPVRTPARAQPPAPAPEPVAVPAPPPAPAPSPAPASAPATVPAAATRVAPAAAPAPPSLAPEVTTQEPDTAAAVPPPAELAQATNETESKEDREPSTEEIVPKTEGKEVKEGVPTKQMEKIKVSAEDEKKTNAVPGPGVSAKQEGEVEEEESTRPPPRQFSEEEEEMDTRDHLNVVFIGHVDAGKSTIGGQIMFLSGMVDQRTIEKFEREAKDKNRDSWYMAYIMDTNEEERAKGKTVEVGRAHFETVTRRYTVLDAPGHKNYVPNMISGASQADVGVLVISARKGEFETGFEKGGQTREHAQLAKTLGVSKLVVVVNKMDDPSVEWAQERFEEIVEKLTPFLKGCGYNMKKDVSFMPISGLMGLNMKERLPPATCPWYTGPAFFDILDHLEMPERDAKALFRMPLIDKFKDMGTVVMGKIESGSVRRGDTLLVMPNRVQVKVVTVYRDNDEVSYAKPGENLRLRISGIEEDDILPGFVLSSVLKPICTTLEFEAQLQVLEMLDHKAIFTAGYRAILHVHSVVEECEIIDLLQQIDPKTKKPLKKKPLFVKSNAVVKVRIQVNAVICIERFADFPQLGRFTLRDEGKTVAIGKVTLLVAHNGGD